MSFWIGVLIFALGILVSVCLHEAGHMLTAKALRDEGHPVLRRLRPDAVVVPPGRDRVRHQGDPARRLRQDRRDDPAGDDVDPRPTRSARSGASRCGSGRSCWPPARSPTSPRPGHLLVAALSTGLPNPAAQSFDPLAAKPVIGLVSPCVVVDYQQAPHGGLRGCRDSDPVVAGEPAGLQHGDRIVVGRRRPRSRRTATLVRGDPGHAAGPDRRSTYLRDGEQRTATVDLVADQAPGARRHRGHRAARRPCRRSASPCGYPRRS